MPDLSPRQPGFPIELAGVLSAERLRVDAATIVRAVVDVPGPANEYELWVPDGTTAVLRYANYSEPLDNGERVEYVGGGVQTLPPICFSLPGRQGALRVLDEGRAFVEAHYLASDLVRLQRIRQAIVRSEHVHGLEVALGITRHKRRPGANGTTPAEGLRLSRMMEARQVLVVGRLSAVATRDYMSGVFTPETARERALRPPAISDAA